MVTQELVGHLTGMAGKALEQKGWAVVRRINVRERVGAGGLVKDSCSLVTTVLCTDGTRW